MAHKVLCAVCGSSFDRDKIQAVKYNGRRYAHQSCFPTGEIVPLPQAPAEDENLVKLKEYISEKFGDKVNWALVNKQIKQYKEEMNYSYSGMLKSLVYAFDVKKNDISKSKGIGIIPFVYKDAYQHYYSIWLANQKNEVKMFEKSYEVQDEIVKIHNPEREIKKRKLFSFLDEE